MIYWHSGAFSFVNLNSSLQISCGSQGEFQLRLRNFENRNSECTESKCDTSFRVCLKHYQKKVELNDECTFGESFVHTKSHKSSVVTFPLDFKWPVSLKLHAFKKRELIQYCIFSRALSASSLKLFKNLISALRVHQVGQNEIHTIFYSIDEVICSIYSTPLFLGLH